MDKETKTLGDMIVDPNAEDPITNLIRREMHLRIAKAIGNLTPQQRTAFSLTVLHGLTHSEAGDIMGKSKETVKVHVRNARKRLINLLKDYAAEFGIKPKN